MKKSLKRINFTLGKKARIQSWKIYVADMSTGWEKGSPPTLVNIMVVINGSGWKNYIYLENDDGLW